MVNKQSFSVFAYALFALMIAALAVLLLNPFASVQVPAISLGSAEATVSSRLSAVERSAAASVARWEAAADHYIRLTGSRSEAAISADQARWEAVGEFYTSPTSARPEEAVLADQARWKAVGEFYIGSARTADQARWEAAGEFYSDRGRTADQARWEAMGEAYGMMANGQ